MVTVLPAVHHDGPFRPRGVPPNDLHELQDALDGVNRGDPVVGPGRVVHVKDVLRLVRLPGKWSNVT